MFTRYCLTAGLCLGSLSFLAAQGQPPVATQPLPPPMNGAPMVGPPPGVVVPIANTPQEKAFYELLEKMKGLISNLGKLQVEYQTATTPDQQKAVIDNFKPLQKAAMETEQQLFQAAEAAFLVNPQNKEISTFVFESIMIGHLQDDKCTEALRVAKILQSKEYANPNFNAAYAELAWRMNDFTLSSLLYEALERVQSTPESQAGLKRAKHYNELWVTEAKIRAAEAMANDLPRVKLTTSKGDIVVELFENEAPNTVANFVSLVESKFYDGTAFHRVLPGFMAQGGDPKSRDEDRRDDGTGGPGYTIKCECAAPNARMHFRGTLSMAHAGTDTGGSQFFLTFTPTEQLDRKHTAFGRIIEGFDVLDNLIRIDPQNPASVAMPRDKIISATVVRKRINKDYKPVTGPAR